MKMLFAMLALMGAMTFAPVSVMAQDAPAEAADVEEGGILSELKTKYIEGGADFMSLPAIALVLGLASVLNVSFTCHWLKLTLRS